MFYKLIESAKSLFCEMSAMVTKCDTDPLRGRPCGSLWVVSDLHRGVFKN